MFDVRISKGLDTKMFDFVCSLGQIFTANEGMDEESERKVNKGSISDWHAGEY